MQYWLFKSEPDTWGWHDQTARGEKGEEWDGVRNYQARNFMRQMALGDQGFFYHSQKQKAIVGIVEVIAVSSSRQHERRFTLGVCGHQKPVGGRPAGHVGDDQKRPTFGNDDAGE